MQILSYCVLIGTLVFLGLNGGEDATTTTWALSLCGILTALVLMVKGKDEETRHAAPQGDKQTNKESEKSPTAWRHITWAAHTARLRTGLKA